MANDSRKRFVPYCFQTQGRKDKEIKIARRFLEKIREIYKGTDSETSVLMSTYGAAIYLNEGGNPRKVISQISKYKPNFKNCLGTQMPIQQETPPFVLETILAEYFNSNIENRNLSRKPITE